MTENIDRCPLCGSSDIEVKIAPVTFEWGTKGEVIIVENCEELLCNYCKEGFFTKETSNRIEETIREYLKAGDYGSDEI
jgi:YgiT-type zinc finger domain-containing protein